MLRAGHSMAPRSGSKSRKTLLGMTTVACGILGLVLFRWTPTTGKGVSYLCHPIRRADRNRYLLVSSKACRILA